MNKQELTENLAIKLSVTQQEAEKFIQAFTEVVTESLKQGTEVSISGFGAFAVLNRTARQTVNPRNLQEKIAVPAIRVPKFRPGKNLKEAVRNPIAQ